MTELDQTYSSFIEYHIDKYLETHDIITIEEIQNIVSYFQSFRKAICGVYIEKTRFQNGNEIQKMKWYKDFCEKKSKYIDLPRSGHRNIADLFNKEYDEEHAEMIKCYDKYFGRLIKELDKADVDLVDVLEEWKNCENCYSW